MKLIQVQGSTLLGRESSTSKRVSRSKILFQPESNPSYSFIFFIIFNLLELGEFFFLLSMLDSGFLGGVREGGASRHHMSTFATAEAKSLLGTLLSFFRGEFLGEFDYINIYGIGVLGGPGGR